MSGALDVQMTSRSKLWRQARIIPEELQSSMARIARRGKGKMKAVPQAGSTLQALAGRWAHPIHDALVKLTTGADPVTRASVARTYRETYSFPAEEIVISEDEAFELGAAAALSIVILARANGLELADLAQAEEWFLGPEATTTLGFRGLSWFHRNELSTINGLNLQELDATLLPHVFEVFVTGPVGRSRHAQVGRRNNRIAKRRSGAFYTPADVADYISRSVLHDWLSRHVISNCEQAPICLDPACGTGAFLVSMFQALVEELAVPTDFRSRIDLAAHSIFGIDISLAAVQAARFALLGQCLSRAAPTEELSPWGGLRGLKNNFAVLDARTITGAPVQGARRLYHPGLYSKIEGEQPSFAGLEDFSTTKLSEIFPKAASGFDLIVGNPPYAVAGSNGKRVPAYLPFVAMMWRLAARDASAGMVVPLSIAYNGSLRHRTLRKAMAAAKGHWRIAFFDRTPDSLFGDDVKIRNAILLLGLGPTVKAGLSSTHLLRWNSRNRASLFRNMSFQPCGWDLNQTLIPKLGSPVEVEVYSRLRQIRKRLDEAWTASSGGGGECHFGDRSVHFASTAYNWLPAFRRLPSRVNGALGSRGEFAWNGWSAICEDPEMADIVFGVVSSHLAYWLWRVEGDGFHLGRRFIARLPFGIRSWSAETRSEVAVQSRRLWDDMRARPVRSVNGGRTSISFSPESSRETIQQIDTLLCATLELPPEFPGRLKEFVIGNVAAGR